MPVATGETTAARVSRDGRTPGGAVSRACHGNLIWAAGNPEAAAGSHEAVAARHVWSAVSEDAERATGCEMALDIEGVVDSGMNRREPLR
jgi:hypothetical protein